MVRRRNFKKNEESRRSRVYSSTHLSELFESMNLHTLDYSDEKRIKSIVIVFFEQPPHPTFTGGKRAYGPGLFGPLVPVAEPGSITRDQCRSRFQHEPGPRGLHVGALRREGAWVIGPGS
jgi:hypothetical protein